MDTRAFGSGGQPSLGHTNGSVFESVFVRGGEVPPGLRQALLAIGVDLDQLEARYPTTIWAAALDLAGTWLYPGAPSADEAEYEVGRRCVTGYLASVPGKILGVVLPLLSARTFLSRLPTYNRMARDDLSVELVRLGAEGAVVQYTDPAEIRPHFVRGALDALLERTSTRARTTVTRLDTHRCEVVCSWPAD